MDSRHLPLVERLMRIVLDRGDLDLLLALDRIMDQATETDQAAALARVVAAINVQRAVKKEA